MSDLYARMDAIISEYAGHKVADVMAEAARQMRTATAQLTARAKDMVKAREGLINIRDGLDDEIDRVYFGSTSDADQFRATVDMLDDWAWGDIIGDTKAPDYIGEIRTLRARLEALEKAAAPFVREAKNWPDYVPDSDGLFIASPDDILPILEENASQYGRASCGISYSDDVVTVGDLRALARAAGEGETK